MLNKLIVILYRIAIVLLAAVVISSVAISRKRDRGTKCREVRVCICDSTQNRFLSAAKVRSIIARDYGGCVNRPLDSINLYRLERILKREKPVSRATAWKTPDGILHIDILQRTPVAKLEKEGSLYYLDENGIALRVAQDWCASLITISGNPPVSNASWLKKTAYTAIWLSKREKWNDRITSCTSDNDGNLTLRLTDRREDFIIGQPGRSGIKRKMEKIRIYENKIAPTASRSYRSVNVKYNGQIICK